MTCSMANVGHNIQSLELSAARKVTSLIVAIAALVGGLWLLTRATLRRRSAPDNAAMDAALLALALVAAPIVWPHYQLLLLPGIARLASDLAETRRRIERSLLAIASLVANWYEPVARSLYLAYWTATIDSVAPVWLVTSIPTIASAVLFTLQLRRLARPEGQPEAARSSAT